MQDNQITEQLRVFAEGVAAPIMRELAKTQGLVLALGNAISTEHELAHEGPALRCMVGACPAMRQALSDWAGDDLARQLGASLRLVK
jgi:hypothetical protein